MTTATRYKVIDTALCIGESVFDGEEVVVLASDYDRDTQALKDELDNIKRSWGLILSQRDALAAERSWAETELPKWRDLVEETRIERDELRAQVEVLRADAERYRWIRSRESECNVEIPLEDGSGYLLPGYHEHLDAAIDAALQAKP